MLCHECGNVIPDEAAECGHCGKKAEPSALKEAKAAWGEGVMVLLAFLSIIFPIVGLGAGICGVTRSEKRGQGFILLLTGAAMTALQVILIYAVLSGRRDIY